MLFGAGGRTEQIQAFALALQVCAFRSSVATTAWSEHGLSNEVADCFVEFPLQLIFCYNALPCAHCGARLYRVVHPVRFDEDMKIVCLVGAVTSVPSLRFEKTTTVLQTQTVLEQRMAKRCLLLPPRLQPL